MGEIGRIIVGRWTGNQAPQTRRDEMTKKQIEAQALKIEQAVAEYEATVDEDIVYVLCMIHPR